MERPLCHCCYTNASRKKTFNISFLDITNELEKSNKLPGLNDRDIISEAKEIMAVFPTVKSVLSTYKSALIQQLIFTMQSNFKDSDNSYDDSAIDNNPKVRIIIPQDKEIDGIIQRSRHNKNTSIRNISDISDIFIDKAVFIIIDRKTSIIIKTDEPDSDGDTGNSENNNNNSKSGGFSPIKETAFSYSRHDDDDDETGSGPVVFSHIAAFEMLWKLTETLQKITTQR